MTWTPERKRDACFEGPMGKNLLQPDTEIVERPGWFQITTPSAPGAMRNEVYASQLDAASADRAIDETVAGYAAHGNPTKWCVGTWTQPDDFGQRLARRGFTSWEVRGMGCSTELALGASEDVVVDEVTERDLDAYIATMLHGWSVSPDHGPIERRVHESALRARPRAAHFFAARVGGELIGTAAFALRGDYGYLLGTQVLEPFRGRGAYRALVAARLARLRDIGIGYAVTHAREETSAPMLAHLGFETLFRYACFLLPATA